MNKNINHAIRNASAPVERSRGNRMIMHGILRVNVTHRLLQRAVQEYVETSICSQCPQHNPA